MKITTESGFTADIDEAYKDDWEFVEAINAVATGEPGSIVRLADAVLGESKEALKEHCKGDNGRVSAAMMDKEIFEIIRLTGKKS